MSASYSIDDTAPRNIVIDGSDPSFLRLDAARSEDTAFEQRVLGLLRRIDNFGTGRIILSGIHGMTAQSITIIPTGLVTESAAIRRGNILAVRFTTASTDGYGNRVGNGSGISPDEALLHELVHCLRRMRTWSCPSNYLDNSSVSDGFDNVEEFYAILITNIYSSESGRTLRRDHSYDRVTNSTAPLLPMIEVAGMTIPDMRYADSFFPRHRDTIELMRTEDFGFGGLLFNQLTNLPTSFNPLRQLIAFESQPRPAASSVRADRGTATLTAPRSGAARTTPRRGRQ